MFHLAGNATLLNNLKVQDRQNRVCTTIAIAIVAEQCAPFTVLPALLNEYRVPELNVQNGVLKSLSLVMLLRVRLIMASARKSVAWNVGKCLWNV